MTDIQPLDNEIFSHPDVETRTCAKRFRDFNDRDEDRSASPIDMKSKIRKLNDSSLARLIKESFDTSVASKSHFHTVVQSVLRTSFLVQDMSSDIRCRFYSNKISLNRSSTSYCKSKLKINTPELNLKNSLNPWTVKLTHDVKSSGMRSFPQNNFRSRCPLPASSSLKGNVRDTIMAKKKNLADAVILARQEYGKLVESYGSVFAQAAKQKKDEDATPLEQRLIQNDDKSVSSSLSFATTATIDEGDTSLDTDSDSSMDDVMSISDYCWGQPLLWSDPLSFSIIDEVH